MRYGGAKILIQPPASFCKHGSAPICQHLGTAWEPMRVKPAAPLGLKIHTEGQMSRVVFEKMESRSGPRRFVCVFFSVTWYLEKYTCVLYTHIVTSV